VGESYRCPDFYNPVDGDEVPVPHFGLAVGESLLSPPVLVYIQCDVCALVVDSNARIRIVVTVAYTTLYILNNSIFHNIHCFTVQMTTNLTSSWKTSLPIKSIS
jgi:hypothetical protein